MPDMTIQQAQQQTVQTLPDARSGVAGWSTSDTASMFIVGRKPLLPQWGTRRREQWLRWYYRHELNTLVQGAFAGMVKKVKSAPWEISGPKSGTAYFQDVLRSAEFGRGWGTFISKVILDYLRHDVGAFVEVIGPGNPMGPITGRITGLAHLDALNCFLTGDPEYPVVYYNGKGQKHLMHRSRVLHLVDMPDGDEKLPGVGMCALSRAAAIVQRELFMNRYVAGRLDDIPAPGIMVASNLHQNQIEGAYAKYKMDQAQDMKPEWGNVLWLYGIQPDKPVSVESIPFSQPPEKFDYQAYKVNIDVNELALALGVDVQELWQLTGTGQLGTAGQSAILHAKSRGKLFGDILKSLERALNDVLPPAYEFEFKVEDEQADLERAQKAAAWVNVINQARNDLSQDEARRLLANVIGEIRDVITDEDGQIVRLSDADPKDGDIALDDGNADSVSDTTPQQRAARPAVEAGPQNQAAPAVQTAPAPQASGGAEDAPENIESTAGLNGAQINAALTILEGVTNGTTAPSVAVELLMALGIQRERAERMVADTVKQPKPAAQAAPVQAVETDTNKAIKAWDDTRSEFASLVLDAIHAAQVGQMDKRRFGVVMRAHLRRLGTQAFKDGLEDGGVNPEDMDDRDLAAVQEWLRLQSGYVTNFAQRVFSNDLSDAQIAAHAEMWGNKSLRDAFQLGQASAGWNQPFLWVLGPTEEHCPDCSRLNGQVHRMRDWRKKGWLPGAETLACKGFNCLCQLKPAPGKRASGRF